MVFPPFPSSRSPSRAPSVPSSEAEQSQTLLLLRQFLQETCDRLNLSPLQIPIPDDRQLCDLSEGGTILIPFLCSALNALKSMTYQLDVLTTQMGNIQSTVATLPNFPAMESALSPINLFIPDLSYRTTTAPTPAPTQAQPVVPPTGATTRPAPPPPPPSPRAPPPKPTGSGFDPDILRYYPLPRVFYGDPRAYAIKFPNWWEANAFRDGKYQHPSSFVAGFLDPDWPKPLPWYSQAALSSALQGNKKNKNPTTPSKVAAIVNSAPPLQ